MRSGGQALRLEKEENENRDWQTQCKSEKEQHAKNCNEYVERRSRELAQELAEWREWIDLVRAHNGK